MVHCLTVVTSSVMTKSTHFVHGSLIFTICLFTMVSKAMSGVKRPVLLNREKKTKKEKRRMRRRGGKEKVWVERKVLI